MGAPGLDSQTWDSEYLANYSFFSLPSKSGT